MWCDAMQKQQDWLARVARNRTSYPVHADDYYGEHVLTLPQYRKWLRTQRAATRRAEI